MSVHFPDEKCLICLIKTIFKSCKNTPGYPPWAVMPSTADKGPLNLEVLTWSNILEVEICHQTLCCSLIKASSKKALSIAEKRNLGSIIFWQEADVPAVTSRVWQTFLDFWRFRTRSLLLTSNNLRHSSIFNKMKILKLPTWIVHIKKWHW